MKNIAMIQDYNCIIPGALAIVATDDTQKQNDYIALGYLINQANIKMAKDKMGIA